jgi:Ser/Thr protein kinase RdoA (MazF antagonist)
VQQSFENLTRTGQIRRMKRLAETALAAYELEDITLKPLQHFFNTTFQVDARLRSTNASVAASAEGARERFVLRIHRPDAQDAATIQSELLWLLALRREAGLVVPEPVATCNGAFVTYTADVGVPEARRCVLFRWVNGRFCGPLPGQQALTRVGSFMATLHQHAETFAVPQEFTRPRWDYEGLRCQALGTDLKQSWAHLTREDRAVLDAMAERVQRVMGELGEKRTVFGLIHADFYERNYLFSAGKVHAIDFDGCGWGYYLFDIGVTLSTLLEHSTYPLLRQAFLTGYRRVRPLSEEHEALIDTFIGGRLMCHILWLAAHVEEPAYGQRASRRIALEIREIKALLHTRS